MTKYEELQNEHQRMLGVVAEGEPSSHLDEVQGYIDQVKNESQFVGDQRDRNQLRAILRYWGSWMFDNKGIFPDTTLLPTKELVPEKRFRPAPLFWGLGGLGLLVLLVAIGIFYVTGLGLQAQSSSPQETIIAAITQTSVSMIPANPGNTATATPTPFVTQAGTLTATVAALLTQAAAVTFTPVRATSTSLPLTGGGEGDYSFIPAKIDAQPVDNCSYRKITITSVGSLAPVEMQVPPAKVEIITAGRNSVVFSGQFSFDRQTLLEVPLREARVDSTYLVKIDYPVKFENFILDFPADCSQNEMTITYDLDEMSYDYENFAELVQSQAAQPIKMDWRLINWGPVGDTSYWTASFQLVGEGIDIDATYWDLMDKAPVELNDQKMVVVVEQCSMMHLYASVASRGRTAEETVYLTRYQPECQFDE